MAPHSSTLAWKIPWAEEPGRLQSMGSLGVGHDWATSLSLFTFMHWRRKWQPTPVFLPGDVHPRDGGAWWAAVHGVAQSRTWLKRLSSSSSSSSRAFLVAQAVKNLPGVQETGVWPWVRKTPWRKEGIPSPIFLLGDFHWQRGLAGYSPWVLKDSDMTERLTLPFCFQRNVVVIRPPRNQGKHESSNAVMMVWRIRNWKQEGVEHWRTGE